MWLQTHVIPGAVGRLLPWAHLKAAAGTTVAKAESSVSWSRQLSADPEPATRPLPDTCSEPLALCCGSAASLLPASPAQGSPPPLPFLQKLLGLSGTGQGEAGHKSSAVNQAPGLRPLCESQGWEGECVGSPRAPGTTGYIISGIQCKMKMQVLLQKKEKPKNFKLATAEH